LDPYQAFAVIFHLSVQTQPVVAPYPALARRILANAETLFRKKGVFVRMGMKNDEESWYIHFPGFHKQSSEDFKAEWQLHPVRFRQPAPAARRTPLVRSQHACPRAFPSIPSNLNTGAPELSRLSQHACPRAVASIPSKLNTGAPELSRLSLLT